LASTGAGLFRSGVAGDLVYRRGEDPQDRKGNNPPTGATGKWWTNDRGQVTALDIKVNNKGKVTGSVSFCGGPEQKIEKGSLVGKSIVFETPGNMGSLLSGLTINVNPRANNGRTQVWNGELVNDDTLTLSSSNSLLCQLPSAVSLMFVRQGSKDRKYVA
jgi:hypothetical protein